MAFFVGRRPLKSGARSRPRAASILAPVSHSTFRFQLWPEPLAIVRLAPDFSVPSWVGGGFTSITRTPSELSIVCAEACVPAGVTQERGRVALGIVGTIPMSTIGILAALCRTLAAAEVPVFALSTFDTDWLLVPRERLAAARSALCAAGHAMEGSLAG